MEQSQPILCTLDDSDNDDKRCREPPKKKARVYQGFKEDPFIYFDSEEPIFTDISNYFGLSENLKSEMFLTRCKDTSKKNTLYYTTEIVRDIVQSNEEKVKIINTGVKVVKSFVLLFETTSDHFCLIEVSNAHY